MLPDAPKFIILLYRFTLDSLRERRDLLIVAEFKRIKEVNVYPNNKYITLSLDHNYNLGSYVLQHTPTISRTERHKQSFMPRAISLLSNSNFKP